MSTKVQAAVTFPGATAMSVAVFRLTDGHWYDFADSTFKATPTTQSAAMAQSSVEPDLFTLDIDTTANAAWTNDNYTYIYYDTSGGGRTRVGDSTEWVQGGQGNLPPATASLSPSDITSIATTVSASVGSSVAIATAARILDTEQAGGGTIRNLLRAVAAATAGKIAESSDHLATTIYDWADPATVRITSVNSATSRIVTIH
jgi:hypothetical protein